MASAGRILIMPKGNYDSSVTYEMLDLVKHNGTSWLAKKTVVGIEPSETNGEYWHKLVDIDLTSLENRVTALENEDDVDLSPYAKQAELDAVEEDVAGLTNDVDSLETSVSNLQGIVDGLPTSSGLQIATGGYTGTGEDTNTKTLSFDFAPKVVIILGLNANGIGNTSTTTLIPDKGAGNTVLNADSMSMGLLVVTKSGNNVTMTDNAGTNLKTYYVCNSASFNYSYIAIG